MSLGTVKVWMEDRGFGFITEDDGTDVFVHVKSLPNSLQTLTPKARVRFDKKQTARGAQAINVVLAGDDDDLSEPHVLPEALFLSELKRVLPNLREEYTQQFLDWGRDHGWVSA
jgi:cold shock CspA family protein